MTEMDRRSFLALMAAFAAVAPVDAAVAEDRWDRPPMMALETVSGARILNVLQGRDAVYVMTAESLEVVRRTGNPKSPLSISLLSKVGFPGRDAGAVCEGVFYGYNHDGPIRAWSSWGAVDLVFGAPVRRWEMRDWSGRDVRVVAGVNHHAAFYYHREICIPFMILFDRWSCPIQFTSRAYEP